MESTSEMETALQFYEAARDNLSLVRVYCYCGNLEKVSFYRLSVQSLISCVFLIHSEDKWRSKYFMLVWLGLEFFQPSDTGQLARVYLCFLASTSQEKSFLATKLSRPSVWLGTYHSHLSRQFQAAEICNDTGDRAASYHLARQFENQVSVKWLLTHCYFLPCPIFLSESYKKHRVRSFDMIRIRISDPRSFGSW